MVFDPCNPCGPCIPANIDDGLFYQMAMRALCLIQANTSQIANQRLRIVPLSINNGASVVPTGPANVYYVTPYAGTIVGYYITAAPSGSIVLDVWKNNGAIPLVGNTIVAAAPPTLASSQYIHGTTLTGWTTSVNINDVFGISVTSVTSITKFTLELIIQIN